jgi:hypothetical protein
MLRRLVLAAGIGALASGAALPEFRATTPISGLKSGYQLVLVDMNKDGKKDLIVVDERANDIAWYENPTWTRHVILENVPRVINLDPLDLDGDGIPEIALAHNFETSPERSVGNVLILKSGPDPTEKWTAKQIDQVPTAHRVRWIQTTRGGDPILLVAPLVGPQSKSPKRGDGTPIYAYRQPDYARTTISSDLTGVLHSIAPVDWSGKGPQSLLTASFDGISLLRPRLEGSWKRHAIADGDPRRCPQCGSSEIKMGYLGKRKFLAAIEPWHGNQVVVYLSVKKGWKRIVLDDTMVNGHALAVGDLDGDGRDEIVAGFRGKGYKLSVFQADSGGEKWTRTILDNGGVAAADCKIDDLNGDGLMDIACSGASTGNVKIYENLGSKK